MASYFDHRSYQLIDLSMGKRHSRVADYNPESPKRRNECPTNQQMWLPELFSPPSPKAEVESPGVDETIIPPPIEYQDQASFWGSSQPPSPAPLVIVDDYPPTDDSPEPPPFSPFSRNEPFRFHDRYHRPVKSPKLDMVTARQVEMTPRSSNDYHQRPQTYNLIGCYDLHDSGMESPSSQSSPEGKTLCSTVSSEENFLLSRVVYQPEPQSFQSGMGGPLLNYGSSTYLHERKDSSGEVDHHDPCVQYFQQQPLNLINYREQYHQHQPENYSNKEDEPENLSTNSSRLWRRKSPDDDIEPAHRISVSMVDEDEMILKNLFVINTAGIQNTAYSSNSTENKIDLVSSQHDVYVIKKFQCSACCKEFVDEKNLHLHYKIHLEPSDFHCPLCDKFYHTKSGLQAHQKNMHQAHNKHRLECPHCDERFLTKFELIEHIGKHVNAFSRRCKKCASAFRTQSELKRHCILQHSDRPFGCPHCSHRSKTQQKMDRHLQSHKLNNQYTCSHCNKKFAFKNSLMKHTTKRRCQVLKRLRDVSSSPKDLLRSAVEEAGFLNIMN